MALYDGAVQVVERAEGEATVHPSTLMHAVTMMESSPSLPLLSLAQQSQLPIESNGYADMGSGAATPSGKQSDGDFGGRHKTSAMMMRYSLIMFFGPAYSPRSSRA